MIPIVVEAALTNSAQSHAIVTGQDKTGLVGNAHTQCSRRLHCNYEYEIVELLRLK